MLRFEVRSACGTWSRSNSQIGKSTAFACTTRQCSASRPGNNSRTRALFRCEKCSPALHWTTSTVRALLNARKIGVWLNSSLVLGLWLLPWSRHARREIFASTRRQRQDVHSRGRGVVHNSSNCFSVAVNTRSRAVVPRLPFKSVD